MGWKYTYIKGIPIEAQYLFKKAMEVYQLGKTETALKYLRQTLVIAPCYSKALFDMGNCLANLACRMRQTHDMNRQSGSIRH